MTLTCVVSCSTTFARNWRRWRHFTLCAPLCPWISKIRFIKQFQSLARHFAHHIHINLTADSNGHTSHTKLPPHSWSSAFEYLHASRAFADILALDGFNAMDFNCRTTCTKNLWRFRYATQRNKKFWLVEPLKISACSCIQLVQSCYSVCNFSRGLAFTCISFESFWTLAWTASCFFKAFLNRMSAIFRTFD